MMKPAENIYDLVHNLDPTKSLSPAEHRETYVPIEDYEHTLDSLRDRTGSSRTRVPEEARAKSGASFHVAQA